MKNTIEPAYRNKAMRKRINVNERIQALVSGDIDVEDLDDEEIRKLQIRKADGRFARSPDYIPIEYVRMMQAEGMRRFNLWVVEAVPVAQATVMELMKSKRLAPGDKTRLDAANMILERYAGKTPDRVQVTAEVHHYENVLADILVDVDDGIEDAEIIEE